MKNKWVTATAVCIVLTGMNASAATLYCAPANQVKSVESPEKMWPYTYSTELKRVSGGVQPALSGWGSAPVATDFYSAVWTDGALACNYYDFESSGEPGVLTLMSVPLGESPKCNFPTNGNKTFCDAPDPSLCPMVCTPSDGG
jgi:hypothetical protein